MDSYDFDSLYSDKTLLDNADNPSYSDKRIWWAEKHDKLEDTHALKKISDIERTLKKWDTELYPDDILFKAPSSFRM